MNRIRLVEGVEGSEALRSLLERHGYGVEPSPDGDGLFVHAIGTAPVPDASSRLAECEARLADVEGRLREREAQLELYSQLDLYSQHSPVAMAMFDREMRYVAVSRSWIESHRLHSTSLIGRSHYEVFPDLPARWLEVHQRCLAGAVEKCAEEPFHSADGRTWWVSWEVRPWHQADGSIGGIVIFSEDVTARHVAQHEVRQLAQRLALATDAASVGVWDWNLVDDEWHATDTYSTMLGYAPGDVDRDGWLARVHEDDRPLVEEKIRVALERGVEPYTYEVRMRHADGNWRSINVVGRVLGFAPDGQPTRQMGVRIDVTARKQAETELRHRTIFLEALIESAMDGILVVDTGGKKLYQNQRMIAMWGIPPEVAALDDDAEQVRWANDAVKDAEAFGRRVAELYAHPDETCRDIVELKNGTILDRFSSPVRDKTGRHLGRIWVFRDITTQRQLEQQLRQSQKLEAIGQLAGGVAHDFNNILAEVMMLAEGAAADSAMPSTGRQMLEEIMAATERAANLTRQLLAFSRRQVLQPRQVDLNDVVTNISRMLLRLIGEDVQLRLDLDAHPLTTWADVGMLDQVLVNLVVNARDAMPGGGRIVITSASVEIPPEGSSAHPQLRPGSYVSVGITDSGTGMAREVMCRIFEPFFTTKPPGQGTGLGLATVFGIVQQHHGIIEVESQIGQGTTFTVVLPAMEAAPASTPAPSPRPRGGTETILLVEDDVGVRRMCRTMLSREGYRVLEAVDGREALTIWDEMADAIDLVLTDIVMPGGLNGFQLVQRLTARRPRIRALFTSGYSAEIAGRELVLGERQAFVPKPCPPLVLLEKVRGLLDM